VVATSVRSPWCTSHHHPSRAPPVRPRELRRSGRWLSLTTPSGSPRGTRVSFPYPVMALPGGLAQQRRHVQPSSSPHTSQPPRVRLRHTGAAGAAGAGDPIHAPGDSGGRERELRLLLVLRHGGAGIHGRSRRRGRRASAGGPFTVTLNHRGRRTVPTRSRSGLRRRFAWGGGGKASRLVLAMRSATGLGAANLSGCDS
jgi:hypothetical protein